MYCFEAHKCTKYDCPVQRKQVMRCWQFLEAILKRPVTSEDCPYAPCDKCNYHLGWEIGLIGESMFPDSPDPTPESLVPLFSEKQLTETAEKKGEVIIESPPGTPIDNRKKSEIKKDKVQEEKNKEESTGELFPVEDDEKIGQPGMRFCYEIVNCPNPECVVRRQQIIQCFSYFSRRSPEDKAKMTCTARTCDQCFYKKGWDMGLLHEGLFSDILEKRKLKIVSADRSKRNTLVEIYLAELSKKPLSRQEEYALAQKIAGDREASELFLMANLKLVMRVAKKFSGGSLGLMDLIQEGNIGLIKAIAKFDHTLGYRFSTYAAYWIRYYMQKAVANQGSTIKIPHHLLTVAHKIRRQIQEFEGEFYRSPSLTELAKLIGLEEEKILSVLRITQTPVSIHAKTGDDEDDSTLEYYLEDKKTLTPEEAIFEKIKNEAVRDAISKLPERLRYIVENFYGFSDEELSLAEIGRRIDVSRERVRQLLAQALQILQKEELITAQNPVTPL